MKLAVVTGASRGFGLALAQHLRSDGWRVVGMSRTAVAPDDVAVDLRRPDDLRRALDAAVAALLPDAAAPDELIVVHNAAAIGPLKLVGDLDADAMTEAVAVNLSACMLLFDAAVARWRALPARKVLAAVGSGAARQPHAGLSVYAATKAAVEQLVRVVAVEQAAQRHPFLPIVVDPGAMDTDMQGALRAAPAQDVPAARSFAQRYREGTLARADAVATWAADLLRSPSLRAGGRYHVRDGPPA
jgi:benzil reductase ((S)-benzoin forming)